LLFDLENGLSTSHRNVSFRMASRNIPKIEFFILTAVRTSNIKQKKFFVLSTLEPSYRVVTSLRHQRLMTLPLLDNLMSLLLTYEIAQISVTQSKLPPRAVSFEWCALIVQQIIDN
jgi:hypothetical protein